MATTIRWLTLWVAVLALVAWAFVSGLRVLMGASRIVELADLALRLLGPLLLALHLFVLNALASEVEDHIGRRR